MAILKRKNKQQVEGLRMARYMETIDLLCNRNNIKRPYCPFALAGREATDSWYFKEAERKIYESRV